MDEGEGEGAITPQERRVPIAFDLGNSVVVLDLDDTLYLERDFAVSGYGVLDAMLESEHGISGFARECEALLDRGERARIFDKALHILGVPVGTVDVAALVAQYRAHRPAIALAPDAARLLTRLEGHQSALITDGPAATQANKIEALGIGARIGRIVLTGTLPEGCGKPHPMAFEMVEQWSGRPAGDHVYIADNGAKDFHAPRRRGWLTVQILREGRIHEGTAPTPPHAALLAVRSLDELGLGEWKIEPAHEQGCDPGAKAADESHDEGGDEAGASCLSPTPQRKAMDPDYVKALRTRPCAPNSPIPLRAANDHQDDPGGEHGKGS